MRFENQILYAMNLKFRCGSLDWVFVAGWMDGQCQSLAIRNLITSTETELGENGDERDEGVGEVEKQQQQQQQQEQLFDLATHSAILNGRSNGTSSSLLMCHGGHLNAPMSALGDAAPEIRGGSIASKEQFVGIEEKLPLRLRVHHVAAAFAAFAASAGTASIAQPPDTKSKSIDNFHS
ncbi:hypothetical protein ACLKA6_017366 [Drosophila palustris]